MMLRRETKRQTERRLKKIENKDVCERQERGRKETGKGWKKGRERQIV